MRIGAFDVTKFRNGKKTSRRTLLQIRRKTHRTRFCADQDLRKQWRATLKTDILTCLHG